MSKTISIYNNSEEKPDIHFFSTLETEIWEGSKCFNCDYCWDIISEQWIIKDSIIECLWQQAWIQNIKIWESCWWHKLIDDYMELRKWD